MSPREDRAVEAWEFVNEFFALGGNGEGWTTRHLESIALAFVDPEGMQAEDYDRVRSVLGEAWLVDVVREG